jgi:hypothetical protein
VLGGKEVERQLIEVGIETHELYKSFTAETARLKIQEIENNMEYDLVEDNISGYYCTICLPQRYNM